MSSRGDIKVHSYVARHHEYQKSPSYMETRLSQHIASNLHNGNLSSSTESYDDRFTGPSNITMNSALSTPEQSRKWKASKHVGFKNLQYNRNNSSHSLNNRKLTSKPPRTVSSRSSSVHSTRSQNGNLTPQQNGFYFDSKSYVNSQSSSIRNIQSNRGRDNTKNRPDNSKKPAGVSIQYFTPQVHRRDRGRRNKNHCYSESKNPKVDALRSHSPSYSVDTSLIWDPYDEKDSETAKSEALVDSCLQDLEDRDLRQRNKLRIHSDSGERNMYDNRLTKNSSYSYSHQSGNSYTNQNGHVEYNTSHRASYNAYDNNEHDISLGSLRSHDIMEPEDTYDFGMNVKSYRRDSRAPSRASSIRSNRSSMRRDDTVEEYDIITSDQVRSSSRLSSSRRSDVLPPPSYTQHNSQFAHAYSTENRSRTQQRASSGDYTQQFYSREIDTKRRNSIGSFTGGVRRSQSAPRSRSLPRSGYTRKEQQEMYRSSTLPRHQYRPPSVCHSEPPAEAVVEEERINPDGSTVLIRRVVTATTTHAYNDSDVPKVEVHISPATETIISPPTTPKRTSQYQEQFIDDNTYENTTTTRKDYVNDEHFIEENYVDGHFDDRGSIAGSQRGQRYYGDTSLDIQNTSLSHHNESNTYVTNTYITNNKTQGYPAQPQPSSMTSRPPRSSSKASSITSRPLRPSSKASSITSRSHNRSYVNDDDMYTYSENTRVRNVDADGRVDGGYELDDSLSISSFAVEKNGYTGSEVKQSSEASISLHDLLLYLKCNDLALKANAAGYIMHVSYNNEELKKSIRELDIIPPLVKLLDNKDEDCHRNAAGALKNLSYGRFVDDNKTAIARCGGVSACIRLLYSTSWIEVRENITGVLWNISSVETIKKELLDEALEAVALLIVIPLSGWEKEDAETGKSPGVITWSTLLRNSTGVLRNVSSCGLEARKKMRSIEGLIDALVWILKAVSQYEERDDINNKIIENIMCTLRNLSYKVDAEIDRSLYLDASKVAFKNSSEATNKDSNKGTSRDNNSKDGSSKKKTESVRQNGKYGFIHMKKKPYLMEQKSKKLKGNMALTKDGNKKPPPEQWKYLVPVRENAPTPFSVELLWQQSTVNHYIYLIMNSENPVTLEAACAAIHNLCGGKWNWAALLRVHVRLQKGIPPMHDLLSVDQEYVVRSVAYALRNLAIDRTNKWSIGKFAHASLMQIIPAVETYEVDKKTSEYTIRAILSTLQVLVHKDGVNATYVKDDGIDKLVALTREPTNQKEPEKKLRIYSERIVIETNRVLMSMWEDKQCRAALKELGWSFTKAEELDKSYKNKHAKKKSEDFFAEMEPAEVAYVVDRDSRRFFNVAHDSNGSSKATEEHELHDFGQRDVTGVEGENEPLVRRNTDLKEKNKKNNWFKRDNKENVKNSRRSLTREINEDSKLMDRQKDTSF